MAGRGEAGGGDSEEEEEPSHTWNSSSDGFNMNAADADATIASAHTATNDLCLNHNARQTFQRVKIRAQGDERVAAPNAARIAAKFKEG